MHQTSTNQHPRPKQLASLLWEYKRFWIVSAILGFVLATAYVFLLRSETWTARQSFSVRDDLLGDADKPGRFESQESLLSAQETILEIARRPHVVRSVLEQLGPESNWSGENWITDEIIEETQGQINFSGPNGTVFGQTEVIVLTARSSSRERTRKFIEILSTEISAQVNRVRSLRLSSMESELEQAYLGAREAQQQAMTRLSELDNVLGADISVINALNDAQNGETSVKSEIADIKTEIRNLQAELQQSEGILAGLLRAFDNPENSDLPSAVLQAQPSLEKMQDDLIEIQSRLAITRGRFKDRHVEVQTLMNAIEIQRRQIHNELTNEMEGAQAGIAMIKNRIQSKMDHVAELESHLVMLSKRRTEYLALNTQVRELTEEVLQLEKSWGQTKSLATSARTVGLMTPVDETAQVSTRPDGASKRAVALAGLLAGLMFGVGLVLLVAPGTEPGEPGGTPVPLQPRSPQTEPNRDRQPSQPIMPLPPTSTVGSAAVTPSMGTVQASATQQAPPTASVKQPGSISQPTVTPKQTIPVPTQPQIATAPVAKPQQAPAVKVEPPTTTAANTTAPISDQPVSKAFRADTTGTARPVDLAKSAEQQKAFVRVPQSTPPTASQAAKKPEPQRPTTPSELTARGDNPFLRAIAKTEPTPKIKADQPTNQSSPATIQKTPTVSSRPTTETHQNVPLSIPATPAENPIRESEATIQLERSNGDANGFASANQNFKDAIPDQIRKLSDSIQRFGKDKS